MHGVFSEGHLGQFEQMVEQALAGKAVRAILEAGGEYTHLEDVLRGFLAATDSQEARGQILNLSLPAFTSARRPAASLNPSPFQSHAKDVINPLDQDDL
jgi:nucleoside-diphosphate-sugar epimerase